MAKKRKLTTVLEVVEAFGGPKAASEWADVGMPAVSNWVAREFIPPGWHYRMTVFFGAKGIEIDPSVFGQEPLEKDPKELRRSNEQRRVA